MLTDDQSKIIDDILSSERHARLRGRAGTGKTFTFKHMIRAFRDAGKFTLAVTPTGAAACRIEDPKLDVFATTIHKMLGAYESGKIEHQTWPGVGQHLTACALGNKKTVEKLKACSVLLIDECSMVGARMFDTMHEIFAKARGKEGEFFGGVKVVFCGDFLQLPPVRDNWLFESRYYRAMDPQIHSLTKILRTDEPEYVDFQNFIRARTAPVFGHPGAQRQRRQIHEIPDDALLLVHTNAEVDAHNAKMAEKLFPLADFKTFPARDQDGKNITVNLCTGMRVMALANHPQLEYANSSVGTIVSWGKDDHGRAAADVDFDGSVSQVKWKEVEWEGADGKWRKNEYYPLKPAYAATINKIQGITADRVAVQCKNRADHGRLFVALTRCRTLGGMYLILPDDAAMAYSEKVSNSEF